MAKKRINREKDFNKGSVKFTVLETGAELVCNLSELPKEITNHLLVHAINAKVGDSAADPKVDAMTAMQETWAQLVAGEWNARSGEGSGAGRVTLLAEGIALATERSIEDVVAMLAEKSEDEKKELRKHAQVKAAIEQITAKRAAEKAKASAKAAKDADKLVL